MTMKYIMLLRPHANARYQSEELKLAQSELRLMLDVFAPEVELAPADIMGMPALSIISKDKLSDELLEAIKAHSLLYGLFECTNSNALLPITARANAMVGEDLPAILKYKGKTNEVFLQLLINAALFSSGFARKGNETLELLDPMCSRATTLFVAANRGWNSCGLDVDKNDLSEAERFLKRYFEYHRMKHEFTRESRTVPQGKPVPVSAFKFAADPNAYRRGDTCSLRFAHGDASLSREIFGKEKFHLLVCDLPYGVQHASSGGGIEALLARALPRWRESLKKGGCVALSFNSNTLKKSKLLDMLDDAGLEARRGAAYEGFSHWVEQAVTRDIVVARRTN